MDKDKNGYGKQMLDFCKENNLFLSWMVGLVMTKEKVELLVKVSVLLIIV